MDTKLMLVVAIAAMFAASCAVGQPIQPLTVTPLNQNEGSINVSNRTQAESQSNSENPTNGMSRLFGKNTAFTATAVTKGSVGGGATLIFYGLVGALLEHAMNPSIEVETHYAFLDGKLRVERDMAKSLPKNVPKKSARFLHTIVLTCPDKNTASGIHIYMIYPDLNAYCEEIAGTNATYNRANLPKTERTEIGRETVEGHPCVKYKEVTTLPDGKKVESTVWQATDLNDFPIKTADSGNFTMTFKDINFNKPPADLFELPAGFKRYESMQEMMMDSLKK
jgi:hypothetical protein